LHDALRVSDINREIGEVDIKSNGDFLGMTISVFSLEGRSNKAVRSKSFYALFQGSVLFYSLALEMSLS